MERRRRALGWLLSMVCTVATNAAFSQTVPDHLLTQTPSSGPTASLIGQTPVVQQGFMFAPLSVDELPPQLQDRVRSVIEHPTLSSRGPLEAFHCRPSLYNWLLDHADVAAALWRGLGAKCTDIYSRGEGNFMWKDAHYGEVHWQTIVRNSHQRVWYAEGRVKAGVMLPAVSIRAVVVLNYQEGSDGKGKPAVRHQMDMILHTDSRAVSLATRLFGASAPRMAEEYVAQMEMFFGALAWYLSVHPDKATTLFQELKISPDHNLGG